MKVYYLVYKLTNTVNGKICIGCHMTKNVDDGYMGSGKRLAYAKKKYGVENFKKEILSFHESPEEMLAEEVRLVNEEFLGRANVYNLTCGGRGSWFYVNQTLTPEQRTKAGLAGGFANQRNLSLSSLVGSFCDLFRLLLRVPMSSTQYIARMNAHMQLRAQLLTALDKAISEVGQERVALALIDKVKAAA